MKNLFVITALLAGFMFLYCPCTLANDLIAGGEKGNVVVETQDDEREEELPDDPLERQPADKGGVPNMSGVDVLPPLKSGLGDKMKSAFESIRDALRRYSSSGGSDFPVVLNESVDRHIRCFTGPKRDVFGKWLFRAKKYEPTIRGILKKNDLPEDLVYVAMIESGFNMKACSRARAMGPWQFMDGTGRQYGLRVDYWVDERYDLEKSTVAAARYLKKLFDQFGCWYLVAASYNAGENRVKKAMETHGTKDFWELREHEVLPRETQEYVPQLIAAAVIAKDPERYGFTSVGSTAVYNLTKVTVPGGVPLKGIAHALSIDLADLRALNPELLQRITPPDRKAYQIKLPGKQEAEIAERKVEECLRGERRVIKVVQHRVRPKDSVAAIERLYKVARADLSLVNADGLHMEKGQVLYIPRFAGGGKDMGSSRALKGRLTVARTEAPDPTRKARSKVLATPRMAAADRKTSSGTPPNPRANLVALHVAAKAHSMQGQRAGAAAKAVKAATKRNSVKTLPRKT